MNNQEFRSEYSLRGIIKEILSYKVGIFSVVILGFFIIVSIYTFITFPYKDAVYQWNNTQIWVKNPRNAQPSWWQIFSTKRIPSNIHLFTEKAEKNILKEEDKVKTIFTNSFSYNFDDFPTELNIFFNSRYSSDPPIVKIYWEKPDGDRIFLKEHTLRSPDDTLYLTNDFSLERRLQEYIAKKLEAFPNYSVTTIRGLFVDYSGKLNIYKGNYKIILEVEFRNQNDTLSAETVIYGRTYGIAGTDHQRRPLHIALLWGTPLDLSFGLGASLSITILHLVLATISGWFAGKVDTLIQRLTEIYMILPFLPLLIMISIFYKLNLWSLLIVLIMLSIFGTGVKTNRALVLQVKNLPYIEAAQAYGASNWRIIFLYIIPKILPPVIPGLVAAVPAYVFLEAILSMFGVVDPTQPTWGRILEDAFGNGALYKGYYYWVLIPSFLLILTAISFSLLGFVLDRIVNPKLKEM